MVQAEKVAALLGGPKDLKRPVRNEFDLIELANVGLPSKTFRTILRRSGLAQTEVVQSLGISRTTLLRRLKSPRLGIDESEKTIRLARVFTEATELFDGDGDKAREWLKRSNRALAGKRPLDMLNTELGARQVELVIGRLREGIFG
jgi:putative toxin-antitoxin system antitoxin component (TIGR02293 family)